MAQPQFGRRGAILTALTAALAPAGVQLAPTVTVRLTVGGRDEARMVLSVLPAATIGGAGMLGVDRLPPNA